MDLAPYLLWACGKCGGCAATIATLRKSIQHETLRRAWNRTVGANRRALMDCPGCRSSMHRVPISDGPEIDLCRQCQMMWFDADELAQMPSRSEADIASESWGAELRDVQRRRESSEFFARIDRRHWFGWP
jgi:Zn-finger nucleic acid-binding protein